jgi:hypothetical protein
MPKISQRASRTYVQTRSVLFLLNLSLPCKHAEIRSSGAQKVGYKPPKQRWCSLLAPAFVPLSTSP